MKKICDKRRENVGVKRVLWKSVCGNGDIQSGSLFFKGVELSKLCVRAVSYFCNMI